MRLSETTIPEMDERKQMREMILWRIKGNLRIRADIGLFYPRILRQNDTVITDGPPLQGIRGLPAGQAGAFQGSFDHNPCGMTGKGRFQQLLFL